MGLLGSLIGTVVQVAVLPVRVAADVVMMPADAVEGNMPLQRTVEGLEKVAEELI